MSVRVTFLVERDQAIIGLEITVDNTSLVNLLEAFCNSIKDRQTLDAIHLVTFNELL